MKLTNKMQLYRLIYYYKSALHVSGDVFAQHQEHLTVFTASGSVHCSEHYHILQMQSSAPDAGRKHRPKYVQLTLNNKLIYILHLADYFRN
jgi:hypothetical protein